jgi:hypothetical protein
VSIKKLTFSFLEGTLAKHDLVVQMSEADDKTTRRRWEADAMRRRCEADAMMRRWEADAIDATLMRAGDDDAAMRS